MELKICLFEGCILKATIEGFCKHCYENKVIPARLRLALNGGEIKGRESEFKHDYGPEGGEKWDSIRMFSKLKTGR